MIRDSLRRATPLRCARSVVRCDQRFLAAAWSTTRSTGWKKAPSGKRAPPPPSLGWERTSRLARGNPLYSSPPEADRPEGDKAIAANPTSSRPRVLLVDDVGDNREIYAQHLRFHGYRIDEADTAELGLAKARFQPDVIVMDLAMPGMDGVEACRLLRAHLTTKRIPIIVLTGHAYEHNRVAAMSAGCDVFLVKPCAPDVLQGEIEALLRSRASKPG